jgi:hypothetical protein
MQTLAEYIAQELMAQNMLAVPIKDALPVIQLALHEPRNQPGAKPGTILWCGSCRTMNEVGPDGEVIHKPVDAGQHSEA